MKSTERHVYYFRFGFLHPSAVELWLSGDQFDAGSSRILPISASSESEAFEWGITVVKWLLDLVFRDYPHLGYTWIPEENYREIFRDWPENSIPCGEDMPVLESGVFPEFATFRKVMRV